MNKSSKNLGDLPKHFSAEEKQLLRKGIQNWDQLSLITDKELHNLTKGNLATSRNLIMLRGMAKLICTIDLCPSEAALLLHSGIASIRALATSTPQELVNKTSKFERQLKTYRLPIVNLKKASHWINSAKRHLVHP